MFFIAYLCGFVFARALATIPVAVTSNQPACPGESVAVQCTVRGDVLTWHTPDGVLNLLRDRQEEGDAGSFHWTLLGLDASTLQSTLTFSATTEFAIECSNTTETSSASVQVEGPPSAPDRPVTALDKIQRINDTFSSVSVVWDIPETNNNYISRYVVTVDPHTFIPANGVIESTNPQFQARKITLVLMHEQIYSVRVRADNCNNTQLGIYSSSLTINIQVPPAVSSCASLPVYDYFSDNLTSIEIHWEPLPDSSEQITADITADVQSYNVSIVPIGVTAPTINIIIDNDLSTCGDVCSYVFQPTSEMTALHYSVFVTAKNILIDGYGESTICSSQAISPRNDIVAVAIQHEDTDVEISCRFFTRFEGEPLCEIAYSMNPSNDVYISKSSVLPSLEPNKTYDFEIRAVNGGPNFKVLGTFETVTQCQSSDLGTALEGDRIECRKNERAALIPDGVVCYSGTATGSLAYTACDKGYQLDSSPGGVTNPRECSQNGNWSGSQPRCTASPVEVLHTSNDTDTGAAVVTEAAETCTTGLAVLGTVTFLVSFLAGAAVGAVAAVAIHFLQCRLKKRTHTRVKEASNPVYQASGSIYEYISHVEKDREIVTENNQCYVTKDIPELPKPRVSQSSIHDQ